MPRPAWHSEAACRGRLDVMAISREDECGRESRAHRALVAHARAICRTCPVIDECRAWANQLARQGQPIVDMVVAGRPPRSLDQHRRKTAS